MTAASYVVEVLQRQPEEIQRTNELQPPKADDERGQEDGGGAKDERAPEAVEQRLPLQVPGEVADQDGEHRGVVGREQRLEHDKERDGADVPRHKALIEHASP